MKMADILNTMNVAELHTASGSPTKQLILASLLQQNVKALNDYINTMQQCIHQDIPLHQSRVLTQKAKIWKETANVRERFLRDPHFQDQVGKLQ